MAGDNKLTFDPPTRLPELTQNLIRSSHGHSTPSLKISCKSVQPFSRNVADKETNKERKKETKKERNRSKTIPRPATGGGVIKDGINCTLSNSSPRLVYGRFPDSNFPGWFFSRKDVSRKDVSRTVLFLD